MIWKLTKGHRRAHAAVRRLAHGNELRIYVDDKLVISHLHRFQPSTDSHLSLVGEPAPLNDDGQAVGVAVVQVVRFELQGSPDRRHRHVHERRRWRPQSAAAPVAVPWIGRTAVLLGGGLGPEVRIEANGGAAGFSGGGLGPELVAVTRQSRDINRVIATGQNRRAPVASFK